MESPKQARSFTSSPVSTLTAERPTANWLGLGSAARMGASSPFMVYPRASVSKKFPLCWVHCQLLAALVMQMEGTAHLSSKYSQIIRSSSAVISQGRGSDQGRLSAGMTIFACPSSVTSRRWPRWPVTRWTVSTAA